MKEKPGQSMLVFKSTVNANARPRVGKVLEKKNNSSYEHF